jgi:hypothetical protein
MATVESLLRPADDLAALLRRMREAFDLDTAVGKQLDAVGVRVGCGRHLRMPLDGVYFAWDAEDVGWSEGAWKGLYDPDMGMISLPDDMYRLLLKAKVAANRWDGTIPGAYEAWEIAFADLGSLILIQDNQDMSMAVGIAGTDSSRVFEQIILQGYIPIKPEGVRVTWYAVTPDGGALFAWDCDLDERALAGWEGDDQAGGSWFRELFPIQTLGA